MGCQNSGARSPQDNVEVFIKYDFVAKLGTGASSQVHEAALRSTGESVAVKCVVKEEASKRGDRNLHHEATLMKMLRHENICRIQEIFEDTLVFYFVMELCRGGKLFDRLEVDIVLEEDDATRIGREMASAVSHVHERGIVHRDMKPENWLLSGTTPEGTIKLINFSLAELCDAETTLTQPCGTLHYVAPEVLRGGYGQPTDMWTVGVVIFLMLYASYPFDGESCSTVMRSILGSEPDWSDSCYALSTLAKDFLKQCLTKDPSSRITADKALRHGWLCARPATADSNGTGSIGTNTAGARRPLLGTGIGSLSGGRKQSVLLQGVERLNSGSAPAELPQIKGGPGQTRRMSALVTTDMVNAAQLLQRVAAGDDGGGTGKGPLRGHPFAPCDSPNAA